jgi:tetratricopeptide (TPR) repeat protein
MAAQKAAPQKQVTVVVMNAHSQPTQPVAAVRVALSYLDSGIRVTGAQDATNRSGEAFLRVAPDAAQRGDLRLEVSGTSDLAIYQPPDGQLPALPASVTVNLLPRGSAALLGPAQLEAMLRRLSLHLNSLQEQNKALKAGLSQAPKPDMAGALAEVAQAYGFQAGELDTHVKQWAKSVQDDPAASAERRALAAFAEKNYDSAQQLFGEVEDDEIAAQNERVKQQQEENRAAYEKILHTAMQRGNALQLLGRYHEATAALARARDYIGTQQKASPADQKLERLWLQAVSETANARRLEGDYADARNSMALLAQTVDDDRNRIARYAALGDVEWKTRAQGDLGAVLDDEGERAEGGRAGALYAEAAAAFRDALRGITQTSRPALWARLQDDYGNVLLDQGETSSGAAAARLMAQSVEAHRAALEVYTQQAFPKDWARSQENLGIALGEQAQRSSGPGVSRLLDQSVEAYGKALQVYTRATDPREWARLQVNLAVTLTDKGERSSGEAAQGWFAQAVARLREALKEYKEEDVPQDWANVQSNLANALMDLGEVESDETAAASFAEAVEACRAALRVYTHEALPQEWASVENNLGNALLDEGEHSSGEPAISLYAQGAEAYRNALKIYTREAFPQDWAMAQANLGNALSDEAERSMEAASMQLLKESAEAYRLSLEVYTQDDFPQD